MQETLIHETDIERLIKIRREKYISLTNEINLLNWRKNDIINNFNAEIKKIDRNIILETAKERYAKNNLIRLNLIKKQKFDR